MLYSNPNTTSPVTSTSESVMPLKKFSFLIAAVAGSGPPVSIVPTCGTGAGNAAGGAGTTGAAAAAGMLVCAGKLSMRFS